MARISITGLISESLAAELNDLIVWFVSKHGLDVKINLKISLSHPSANPQDNGLILQKGPKTFEIWLFKCLSPKQLQTEILHELIHLKQITEGRLVQKFGFFYFDGQRVTEPYAFQLHEIEARKFAEIYHREYLTFVK